MSSSSRRSVTFDGVPDSPQTAKAKAAEEAAADMEAFMQAFSETVARRDYRAAMDICRKALQKRPGERYVLEMRKSVEDFLDATEALETEAVEEDEDEELPPQLDEMADQAFQATGKAYEAMYSYLKQEENLWAIGEQAVGIFWDAGQIAPDGPRRDRLKEMSIELTKDLGKCLQSSELGQVREAVIAGNDNEWLFEGLGQLWFQWELDMELDAWLVEGCVSRLQHSGGQMKDLVGYAKDSLHTAPKGKLCDLLMEVWTLERSYVGDLFKGHPTPPPLEFGVREVLAEIRRRPLVEPPLSGFYQDFYLMTHLIYALNCFNGSLPNRRSDCPWVYSYIERCLAFWLREGKRQERGGKAAPDVVAAHLWETEAVDAIAECVDCLLGLGEPSDDGPVAELIREGCAWLLTRQEADGFFYSPSISRSGVKEYDHLHPTWVACGALQFDRKAPGPSPRCDAWAAHMRAAALEVGLAEPPPVSSEAEG